MGLSKEAIDEFKEIYKKNYNKELSDAEASEAANNLVGLYKVLYDIHVRELKRKRRLRKEPEGFIIEDGEYTCSVCHGQIFKGEMWYDKWGMTCKLCRKAVQDGIVPEFACRQSDSWYPMWQLERKFEIKHQTARKMVREGKLRARIVLAENNKPYEYIFLKKENPKLVDPDRKTPARKSYDRNYNKIMDLRIKKEKEKLRKEQEIEMKKIKAILNKHRG